MSQIASLMMYVMNLFLFVVATVLQPALVVLERHVVCCVGYITAERNAFFSLIAFAGSIGHQRLL